MIKEEDTLSKEIIGAAIDVHRNLGRGLLESAERIEPIHEAQRLTYLKIFIRNLSLQMSQVFRITVGK